MTYWLCTRENVMNALDVKATARDEAQLDRIIEAASRGIENGLLHRYFAPTLDTRYFDWPNDQMGRSWRLWLNDNELISNEATTTVVTGGATLTASQFFLEPKNNPARGKPYNRVERNLAGGGSSQHG